MGKIVVGVDGSDGAQAALEWAYEEATLRQATLHLVHCWEYPYMGTMDVVGLDDKVRSTAELGAQAVLDEALRAVAGAHPDGPVPVTSTLVAGGSGPGLIRESEDADLLVVGARGRGGFLGLLLGSVSNSVVAHAAVPVVVVRPTDQERVPGERSSDDS